MRSLCILSASLCCLAVCLLAEAALAQVDSQRAEKIRAAAPAKASVAPEKARTVLIWNTPPALMDKDPHKGYCIPFGECAFRTLGEKTGAFKPVVSGDLALFAPAKLKQFDAIVMNNSSGPWIQPTDADMERLKPLGNDKQAVEKLLRRPAGLRFGRRRDRGLPLRHRREPAVARVPRPAGGEVHRASLE